MLHMLEIAGLDVGLRREPGALGRVDLEVPAGSVVCLMGRNGVGKTTLLKTIMGLLPAARRARRLRRRRHHAAGRPSERAPAGIGYVPQGREIFPNLTVRENLRMALLGCGAGAAATSTRRSTLFPKLAHAARPQGRRALGRRAAAARHRAARCSPEPKLLLLDEPTEGIQPSIIARDRGRHPAHQGQRGMAVLLVEQYLEFAWRLADAYAIMRKGAIVPAGRPPSCAWRPCAST